MKPLRVLGVQQLLSGLRRGSSAAAGFGAALVLLGWLRDHRRPAKERIYSRRLREGETLKVRLMRGKTPTDETDLVG
ncbi:MAG: hypothetical protein M3349_04780 [Actinomycetota bacterium]|nr:hypothetical protein [Actinomycetota bacterium]